MRVTIVAVGRDRSGPARELLEAYVARGAWPIQLVEVQSRITAPTRRRLADEADRLLRAVPRGAVAVALDQRGRAVDSAAFAARIASWQQEGRSDLAFLIGGADGLAPAVTRHADLVLSLGPMTWPHRLVRVLLAEQLYRASTILAGHPYHRE
jgi:23S rRNA (pseudouridine1915-N3)-methyltransferase